MRRKTFLQFFVSFISINLFFASCSQEELIQKSESEVSSEDPIGKRVGNLIVDKSTVLLDPQSLVEAKTVSSNLLIFTPTAEQAEEINQEAILIGTRYAGGSVENVMGRVKKISINNNIWTIELDAVELEDFILSGSISGQVKLTESTALTKAGVINPMIIQDIPGFPCYNLNQDLDTKAIARFQRIEVNNNFQFPLVQVEGVNIGGDLQLKAGFTPVIEYDIQFKLFQGITNFYIALHAQDIVIRGELNADGTVKFNQSVADLFPIPIAPIVLGPTGLVISPTLGVGPFLNIELNKGFHAKMFDIQGSISYELTDPFKLPVFNLASAPYEWNKDLYCDINATAQTGLDCRVGIGLLFITTNIASVGASARIGVGMDAGVVFTKESSATLDLYGIGQASADVKIGIPPLQYVKRFPIADSKLSFFSDTFTW